MRLLKRLPALALCLAMLTALFPVPAQAAAPMEEILGVYEGYYYASQGQTGVTLTVYQEGGQVKAIFDFYNLPNRTNAKDGKFYMSVRYADGKYYFDASDGTDWIDRPSGYDVVDLGLTLNGYVLSGYVFNGRTFNGDTFSGDVFSEQSGTPTFYAERPNDAYAQIQESVYNGHRYERIDQGMTWSQAKEYAEKQGGYLATITSAEEQAFIERLIANGMKNHYWIGAYRDGNSFSWVTGEPFSYSHWDTGDPNNIGGHEDAVHILRLPSPINARSQAMHWNDATDEDVTSSAEDFFSHANTGFIIEYGAWSNASGWATPELEEAAENDLIPDVLIGRDLKGRITRGEFAAVAVKLYEAMSGKRTIIAMDAPFTDIDCAERLYILKAYNYSIVSGTGPTTYAPDSLITREQMATMLTRVVKKVNYPNYTIEEDAEYPLAISGTKKFADDGDISDFAYASVYFMAENDIIAGFGNGMFAPKNTNSVQEAAHYANATREQALLLSVRCLSNLGRG